MAEGGEVGNGELNSRHLVDDVGTVLTDSVLPNSGELITMTFGDEILTWEGMRDEYSNSKKLNKSLLLNRLTMML